jgi:hypothetical protein
MLPTLKATLADWLTRLTPRRVGVWGALAWLLYALPLLHQHGVTWDSPSLFYGGERTLYWIEHPWVAGALDFDAPEPVGFHSRFEKWPNAGDVKHYPVLPGLVAALSSQVFHDGLGLVDDIDGHHLGLVLFHAAAIFVLGWTLSGLLGTQSALFAILALVFFPTIAGHGFNNAKDLSCVDFYACGIAAVGLGVLARRDKQILLGAVWLGISLACKLNAAFALVTIALWLPFAWLILYWRQQRVPARTLGFLLLVPLAAVVLSFLLWPWLYQGTLPQWRTHIAEYLTTVMKYGIGQRDSWTNYPLRTLLFMTPPLILANSAVFLVTGFRGGRSALATWTLLVLWTAVPLMRMAMPHSGFYDANRHFMEYIYGLCAMAGAGFSQLLTWLIAAWKRRGSKWVTERQLAWVTSLAALGSLLIALLTYAPYEIAYFNFLIGGLGGAQRAALFRMPFPHTSNVNQTEGDYWGSSLREFQRWLHEQDPRPSTVGLCGVAGPNFDSNWDGPTAATNVEMRNAEVVYVLPRMPFCAWRTVRALESRRPILRRVEREGGLIYEILGPASGQPRAPTSPPTAYDQPAG